MLKNKRFLIPLFFYLLFLLFSSAIDLWLTKNIYQSGFYTNDFLSFLYIWGVVPAQITFVVSLLCACFFSKKRIYFLYLACTFFLGLGLISDLALKNHWKRPRPRQVEQFGGNEIFKPVYSPNFTSDNKKLQSLPSGHAACGFYFFSLYFLFRRLNKHDAARITLFCTLVYGGIISYARLVQGGHFLSDIITSAFIMWTTAYLIDQFFYKTHYFYIEKNI